MGFVTWSASSLPRCRCRPPPASASASASACVLSQFSGAHDLVDEEKKTHVSLHDHDVKAQVRDCQLLEEVVHKAASMAMPQRPREQRYYARRRRRVLSMECVDDIDNDIDTDDVPTSLQNSVVAPSSKKRRRGKSSAKSSGTVQATHHHHLAKRRVVYYAHT